jgi:lysozyme
MNCNAAGLALIKSYEKCRLKAYLPTPNDVPTIGYGHTRGVELGDTCTQDEADTWLKEDVQDAEATIDRDITEELTDNQFSALVSLVYNIGGGAFNTSTLRRKLNAGDFDGAAAQFLVWNKQGGKVLGGLVRRRKEEMDLFLLEA